MPGIMNNTAYYFVDSKKDLEDKLFYNFTSNLDMSPDTTLKSRITDAIVNNTSFSADKITLIGYWKQDDRKFFSNELPIMTDEGLSILKNNPKLFFKTFGDKYVSAVTFGKMFFVIYQADISDFSSYSTRAKNAIKRAMELNLKKIFGVRLSAQESAFAGERLADVNIRSSVYGTNVSNSSGPYTNDDFNDLLKSINNRPSEIISWDLKSYSNIDNKPEDSFYKATDYLTMADEWNKHSAFLNYILANSKVSFDLLADCRSAEDKVKEQLEMVRSMDSDARVPSTRENVNFGDLYKRYIQEMKISPKTYMIPPSEKSMELDLSSINDVDSIKIECEIKNKKNFFGYYYSNKPIQVILYIVDEDGNLSEVSTTPVYQMQAATLYEGIKMCDKFKLGVWDPKSRQGEKPDPFATPTPTPPPVAPRPGGGRTGVFFSGSRIPELKITCSYTEKVNDLIWMYLHDKGKSVK
ncbi:MAG TPA: hypothetical protein DDW50_17025 [Firmicutes bacterium]|nr:hypothetical protein [Bacillota bacterium]